MLSSKLLILLFAILLLVPPLGPISVSAQSSDPFSSNFVEVSVRVNASSDDAEEDAEGGNSGDMSRTSSDLELTEDDGDKQIIGIRFNDISIPQGATIISAGIQFTVDETDDDVTNLEIRGEAADDSLTFSNVDNDISDRAVTSAFVSWSPVEWDTVGESGDDQKTPDMSSVVQEIVNRDGWSSGNSVTFVVTGTGHRTAASYDGSSSQAPLLNIQYTQDLTVPGTPTNLSATPGNSQVSLSWTAPTDDGGSAILNYVVEYSTDNFGTFTTLTSTTIALNISDLINGQQYQFRVYAENSVGRSNVSNTASATPSAPPSSPTSLTATRGNSQVSLSWNTPSDDGGFAITDYIIQFSIDEINWTTFADGINTATSATVTGLTNGQQYSFRVSAVNSVGTGNPSNLATATPATVPGAPTQLLATRGNEKANLVWFTSNNGGATITDFVIEYSLDGTNWLIFDDGISSKTSATVTDLTNGQQYQFRVSAVNAVGKSVPSNISATTPATVPIAPTNLSVILSDQKVNLSWTAPTNNGGDPINDYLVEYSVNNFVWILYPDEVVPATATEVIVENLINGQSYFFRVRAANSVGIGLLSDSVGTTPATVPGTPTSLTAIRGNSQVSVTWLAPADNGGSKITDYIIEYRLGNSAWETFADGTSTTTSATVTGLTNGQPYSFRVSAVNSVGTGNPSNITTATPATVPGTPTNLSSTPGNSQVSLSWTAPSNGGSPITDYIIQFSKDGVKWNTFADGTSTATSATVPNLTNGIPYSFRVSAVNSVGTGSVSNTTTVTPATTPGIPTSIATIPADSQITLSWTAPSNGGSPITDYIIDFSSDGGSNWTTFEDGTSSNTSATVTGLTNGVQYSFRVSAVNFAGTGTTSNVVIASPVTVSTFPTALTAKAISSTQIELSWTAPVETGGAEITGYQIERQTGSASFEILVADTGSANTAYSDVGLSAGITYTYRISAITPIGVGVPSGTASATTLAVPEPPTNILTTADNAEITLTWTPPNAGELAITDYVVQFSTDGSNWTTFEDGTSANTSATVTGLTNGQEYSFRIFAVNSLGTGNASAIIAETPFTIPASPVGLAAKRGPNDATLSWTTSSDNGRPIVDYIAQFSTDGITWNTFNDGTSIDTSIKITGLVTGKSYKFRVVSENIAGPSPPSNIATATPATTPGIPINLVAIRGDPAITLTWNPPTSNGGSPITTYVVEISDDDFLTKKNILSASPTLTITDLKTGVNFQFKVRSVNTVGSSLPTSAVSISVFDRPVLDSSLSATAGDRQVKITWGKPANDNGSPITDYRVDRRTVINGVPIDTPLPSQNVIFNRDNLSSLTELLVIGLENGKSYALKVIPINAAGPARTTSVINVIPHATVRANEPALVQNEGLVNTEDIKKLEAKGLKNEYIPSSSVISSENFDLYDKSYNQNMEFTNSTTLESVDRPKDLVSEFAVQKYTPPTELQSGVVWSVPPAIIGLDDAFEITSPTTFVPSPPTNLLTTSGTSGVIPLSWSEPSDNGNAVITGYLIEYAIDGNWFTVSPISDTTSFIIPDLVNGQEYRIRVSAINSAGVSAPSVVSVATPYTVPKIPVDVTITPGNSQVLLSWTAPSSNGGSPITDYIIDYSSDGGSNWTTFEDGTSTDTSATVTGLTNGVQYSFRVSAVNSAGSGAVSVTASDTPFAISTKPYGLSATAISSTRIDLNWQKPDDTGGLEIIGYRVDRNISGGFFDTINENTGNADTTYVDADLSAGVDYSYKVYAITTAGTSQPSGTTSARTFDVPSPPSKLSVSASIDCLQLSWNLPENDGNQPITGYKIDRKSPTTSFETIVDDTKNTSTIYCDGGLVAGTTYTYIVYAINAVGVSGASDIASGTAIGSPSAPLSLSAEVRKNKVQLTWVAPFNNGGSPITDYIVQYKQKSDSSWSTFNDGVGTSTSTVVTELQNNISYSFRIFAVNNIGTGLASTVVTATPSTPGSTAAYNIESIPSGLDVFLPHNAGDTLDNGGKISGVKIKPNETLDSLFMTSTFLKNPPSGVTPSADMYLKFELDFITQTETSATVPQRVINLSATSPQASQVNLSWSAPADGGASITGYKIETSTDQQTWNIVLANTKSPSTNYIDTGKNNGITHYYRVSAINDKGTGLPSLPSSTTPIDVPSAPLNVITTPDNSQVSLSWTAPADNGGSPITDYLIHFSLDRDSWIPFNDGVNTATSTVIPNLTNGQEYTFRIFAVNRAGTTNHSNLVSEIPLSVADRPTSLIATPTSSSEINLSWNAPTETGGSQITGYVIEQRIGDDPEWIVLVNDTNSTETTYSDSDLFAGATYFYRVSSITAAGSSSPSVAAQATTYSVPDAPVRLSVNTLDARISLSWFTPSDDGGLPIIDYIVEYSTNGGTTWKPWVRGQSTNTSTTLFGSAIQHGVTYDLRVSAANSLGSGPPSNVVQATPLTVPTSPRSLSAATPGLGEIILSWTAPSSNGGSPITDYKIRYSDDDGASFTLFSDGVGTATTATVTGLTDGVTYVFTVSAVNSVGQGSATISSPVESGSTETGSTEGLFESIEIAVTMGPIENSVHPVIPANSKNPNIVCPDIQIFFIDDDNETVFEGISVIRDPAGDTASLCAYVVTLQHFSVYGIKPVVRTSSSSDAISTGLGSGNVPLPPNITGMSMYSFEEPTINENGQLVFRKLGSYVPLETFDDTKPTVSLLANESSQFALRIVDPNGPNFTSHVGLYMNLHGGIDKSQSDTYITWQKGDIVVIEDAQGFMKDVDVTTRHEGNVLWVLFNVDFVKPMDVSDILIDVWNEHKASSTKIARNVLQVVDVIPDLVQLEAGSDDVLQSTKFYVVESVDRNCDNCAAPFDIEINKNSIVWKNASPDIRTVISGDQIKGFDGNFKSSFILKDNSYSTKFSKSGYYTYYDILDDNFAGTMIVDLGSAPITDSRLFETPSMPFGYVPARIIASSEKGTLNADFTTDGVIELFGKIHNVNTRQVVLLDISKPDSSVETLKITSTDEGQYGLVMDISESWKPGLYTITATTHEQLGILYMLFDGKNIVPKFTTVISDIESRSVIDDVALSPLHLKHVESLSKGGKLLEIEGSLDLDFNRVDLYLETPDGVVENHGALLNSKNYYWVPITKSEWAPGDYEVTLAVQGNKILSESFSVSEPVISKTDLELAFESERLSRPISAITTSIESEITLPRFDVDVRHNEVSTSSDIGEFNVNIPDINVLRDSMFFSGKVNPLEKQRGFVDISLTRPNGEIDLLTTPITRNGNFETQLLESWQTGEYLIDAEYGGNTIGSVVFYLGETAEKIQSELCDGDNCSSITPKSKVIESKVFATVDWYNPIIVDISGIISDFDSGGKIEILIIKPDNTVAKLKITPSATGEFNVPALYNERWTDGTYTVVVLYQGHELSRDTFSR
ncbi:fibronectin type III domain-containing protein [Nitrosopumilus ureiphilus]|uniref:Fibronectin type-III domain-containing protein n=1 Tax=Nitrosopumilus ureiphilus TaxID=1470067 RepID=A0A7D5M5P1_9ARCH|nr:fibronectin type III domain-containing protein [Nitrosopumilus ureiphilus]QLH07035.1 hypothetical protein C5F50_08115 [Nitrosopumilus ureiphilus]